MTRVKNKVAIITGAARGIGRATAKLLAQEGAVVAVTDVVDGEGRQLADEISDAGGKARYWHLDVTDSSEVKAVIEAVAAEFGGLDVLVNNAGITGADQPTDEIDEAEWDRVININVKGVFLCTRHAIAIMRRTGGGSIINLSSIYGIVGAPDIPPYHASKGAVRVMSKTDALLYAKDGIRVNSVHPGFIWTPLVEQLAEQSEQDSQEFRKALDARHPIGHVGEPEDIAYGILYLASDESKFVTGSELVIDGGYTAQ